MKATITTVVEPRLLDVKEAARYLSTSVWEIRDLVNRGKLPKIQLGRKLVFDRVVLDKFVDSLVKAAA
jgi:excisionase family DNA binding protein